MRSQQIILSYILTYRCCQNTYLTASQASKQSKVSEELEQLENKITNTQTAIATTDEQMAALKAEIAALDQSVALPRNRKRA